MTISREIENIKSGQARAITAEYARLNVLTISPQHVLQAIDLRSRHQLSFWDGLILAGAKAAGAGLLLSELAHARVYDGIRVENPFVTQ